MDLYLRIAPELYLKRLLVAGMTRVFELNRNFRNEGLSRRHNPEFTMLEVYQAFADFEEMAALVEEKTMDPLFVTHCPKELVPLAKLNAEDPSLVDVYELIINGQEISPGYSELNDPDAQQARLEAQSGGETQKIDTEFLTALDFGMPPAGGVGIGIDRLVMMLTGAESIRDVILFPHMRPLEADSSPPSSLKSTR